MGLITKLIQEGYFDGKREEVKILELNSTQKESIRKGNVIWALEDKEFLPSIFAIGLKSTADLNDLKEDDLIVRDITNALMMANYDVQLIREALKKDHEKNENA